MKLNKWLQYAIFEATLFYMILYSLVFIGQSMDLNPLTNPVIITGFVAFVAAHKLHDWIMKKLSIGELEF